jgi:hypothetical protein
MTISMYGIMPAKIWLSVTCWARRPSGRRPTSPPAATGTPPAGSPPPSCRTGSGRRGSARAADEDRHEDHDDLGPLERPAEDEDDRLREDHELQRRQVQRSTQLLDQRLPPCSANTAENSAEPTKSQHTIAVVLAVRNVDSLRLRSSCLRVSRSQTTARPCRRTPRRATPTRAASRVAAHQPSATPTMTPDQARPQRAARYLASPRGRARPARRSPADSDAVVMPNRITASTMNVSTPSGTTESRAASGSRAARRPCASSRSGSEQRERAKPQNHA